MLLPYDECVSKRESKQQIEKALESEPLYQIQPDIYTDTPDVSEEIDSCKCERARDVLNGIFYHGL